MEWNKSLERDPIISIVCNKNQDIKFVGKVQGIQQMVSE